MYLFIKKCEQVKPNKPLISICDKRYRSFALNYNTKDSKLNIPFS